MSHLDYIQMSTEFYWFNHRYNYATSSKKLHLNLHLIKSLDLKKKTDPFSASDSLWSAIFTPIVENILLTIRYSSLLFQISGFALWRFGQISLQIIGWYWTSLGTFREQILKLDRKLNTQIAKFNSIFISRLVYASIQETGSHVREKYRAAKFPVRMRSSHLAHRSTDSR